MLVIPDPRLVRLVAIGKKTTHRFQATKRYDGSIKSPKIAPAGSTRDAGDHHKVYIQAPFGKHGRRTPPLLLVTVTDVGLEVFADLTDAHAAEEGFATIEAFRKYWDNRYKGIKKAGLAYRDYEPVWCVRFVLHDILPAGQRLLRDMEAGKCVTLRDVASYVRRRGAGRPKKRASGS